MCTEWWCISSKLSNAAEHAKIRSLLIIQYSILPVKCDLCTPHSTATIQLPAIEKPSSPGRGPRYVEAQIAHRVNSYPRVTTAEAVARAQLCLLVPGRPRLAAQHALPESWRQRLRS